MGELSITPEVDTEIPAKDTKEMVPDHYGLSVTEEEDPINCSPIGRPFLSIPQGSDIAGSPARFTATV